MNLIKIFKLSAFSVALGVTLGACASHPNQTAYNHVNSATGQRSSRIPTRDDRNSLETEGGAVGGANGPEYRVRTGSNLPDEYNRRGYTTDARDPSYVIDRNDQRLQSANNVEDALRSVPGVSVNGPR